MSEEKIFQTNEKKRQSRDMMSFDGCPNRCRHGYYVDPYRHKRVRCEYCFELRKQLVKEQIRLDSGEGVAEKLRLAPSLIGTSNFNSDAVIPVAEQNRLETSSVDFVLAVLNGLISRVSLGEAVGTSLLINCGKKSHIQNFISPFLVRSYISGLTTAPRLSGLDVVCLRTKQCGDLPSAWHEKYAGLSYDQIVAADTCLIYLDAGAGSKEERELMAVKGLMQLRALSDKSTVIITDYYSDTMYDLIEDTGPAEVTGVATNTNAQSVTAVNKLMDGVSGYGKDLAQYVSVKYKNVKKPRVSGAQTDNGLKDGTSLFSSTSSVGVG